MELHGRAMLQNKNAVITGARRGIGRATVEVFARNGANIYACARKPDAAFEEDMRILSDQYKVLIIPVFFDASEESEIKTAVSTIRKQCANIDILANIAGTVDDSKSFPMSPIENMKRVFDVNFWGATILTQYIARLMMRSHKGSVINVSSVAGEDGRPAQYEYAASKAAMNGATRQLARELWQYGIRVNAVAPGITDTDMGAKIDEKLKTELMDNIIMKRAGHPEEIANVIAFLASDLSSYVTGQIIRVDGGM